MWFRLFLVTQVLLGTIVFSSQPRPLASPLSASEIVDAVNVFRAQYGLAPYQFDARLTSIGQTQSEYQASINTMTHRRPDGSGPPVSAENIAMAPAGQSADTLVRRWTFDQPHTTTMIGFRTGLAGAGAAVGSDGTIYYTLDVTNTGKALTGLTLSSLPTGTLVPGAPTYTPAPTQAPILALLTATPQADGSLIHTVQYGQTLSGIAKTYGLALKDLMALNPMLTASTVIQIGQRLLIRPPQAATPTSPPLPGATLVLNSPTTPPPTAAFTSIPSPVLTLTPPGAPSSRPVNLTLIQWGGIGIAFFGLALAFVARSVRRKPPP